MAKHRWHYTSLSFMDAFGGQSDAEREPYPQASLQRQAAMLDALGEQGWDVYEIKFDENGYPLYFLRLDLDG
ncbi:MAG: hypothetical protein KDA98_14100 [Acidimicrobiales bacterium]|nr:hypothetical protein [Acidimicrobiales bacterium]